MVGNPRCLETISVILFEYWSTWALLAVAAQMLSLLLNSLWQLIFHHRGVPLGDVHRTTIYPRLLFLVPQDGRVPDL